MAKQKTKSKPKAKSKSKQKSKPESKSKPKSELKPKSKSKRRKKPSAGAFPDFNLSLMDFMRPCIFEFFPPFLGETFPYTVVKEPEAKQKTKRNKKK